MKTSQWSFRMSFATALCLASTAMADLTWRVDFSTTSTKVGWSSWNASGSSRTQSFANVDGGPENADITAVLTGSGTLLTYSRNMPAASSINLFRDGAHYNGSGATVSLALSGLNANQSYAVNLWNYDYSFGNSMTQHYFDVTGGGNIFLGSFTNTSINAISGSPLLPNDLHDSRYSLATTLTADSSGNLIVNFNAATGNTKINGFEVITIVPEPATFGLMGLGLMLTAWQRRQRIT